MVSSFEIRPKASAWLKFFQNRPRGTSARVMATIATVVLLLLSAWAFARGAGPAWWVVALAGGLVALMVVYQLAYLGSARISIEGPNLRRFYGPFKRMWRVNSILRIIRCSVIVGSMGLPQPIWCFLGQDDEVLFYLQASVWEPRDISRLASELHLQVTGTWADRPPRGIRKVMWYAKNV